MFKNLFSVISNLVNIVKAPIKVEVAPEIIPEITIIPEILTPKFDEITQTFIEAPKAKKTKGLNEIDDIFKELSIETNDNTEDFLRILFEKVDEKRYYTPKEIGEWSEIIDLFSYLKSPAHVVGKILKSYKFQNSRLGGGKRYFLSKEIIKNIIDLYFGWMFQK